jgi:hypothetical protein
MTKFLHKTSQVFSVFSLLLILEFLVASVRYLTGGLSKRIVHVQISLNGVERILGVDKGWMKLRLAETPNMNPETNRAAAEDRDDYHQTGRILEPQVGQSH